MCRVRKTMGNLNDLAKYLEGIDDEIAKDNSDNAVRVATAVLEDLLQHTPVDTSNAVSNWQVGLGVPVPGAIPPFFVGSKGSTAAASIAAARDAAMRRLAGKKPGESIFISNCAPYIVELNDGSSRQEPAGFVERASLLGRKVATGEV